jgi:hypothetical protein
LESSLASPLARMEDLKNFSVTNKIVLIGIVKNGKNQNKIGLL